MTSITDVVSNIQCDFLHDYHFLLNACLPCFLLAATGGSLYRNGPQTVRYVCGDLYKGFFSCIFASIHIIIQRTKHVILNTGPSRYAHSFSEVGFQKLIIRLPCRFDDPEEGLENAEFLPTADGKKPIRFTDVSVKVYRHKTTKRDSCFCWSKIYFMLLFSTLSLKERPLLACPSSIWAMLLWAVESWDWLMPWPTLA